MKIKVGVSARHAHLTPKTFHYLFGKKELTAIRQLDQPEQFAAQETITIKNGKNIIENIRIVGPLREYNQIELSKTDCYKLRINPPTRMSGDLNNSETLTVIGPKGEITLKNSCIIAMRHIHLTNNDAKTLNLNSNDIVSVRVRGDRGGILSNVKLKIAPKSSLRLHIDVDDANAFNIKDNDEVEIIKQKK